MPALHFASVEGGLWDAILNMCVEPGKMCMGEMMATDAKGGLGMAGVNNTMPLTYDKHARRGTVFGPGPAYVAGICDIAELGGDGPQETKPRQASGPLVGAGLRKPDFARVSLPPLERAISLVPRLEKNS